MRMVKVGDWRLNELLGTTRMQRLLNAPEPEKLLEHVQADSVVAARAGRVFLKWQRADEAPRYFRLVAQIPVGEVIFDQLFNGRSGYRAQYYLSPEEGVIFNRQLVRDFEPTVRLAFEQQALNVKVDVVVESLFAPHSKIWIFKEQEAFDSALEDGLNPPRWLDNGATRGRRAPLPDHFTIDLKGAIIQGVNRELFVDELKLSRPYDLHMRGYT
jgi:hypothetical protein